MIKDRAFIQRKMDHYNKWMLDKTRDPNSRYPGFPEEIAMEFARKEFVNEFLSRPKKVRVKHEKKIRGISVDGSTPSSSIISTQ
jgi:hypothetical protein